MINSHWVCPSGCLSVYMNFFKRLRIWREDRHRAPQAFNTPPLCIFSHPRTTVFRGSGRIKARIDRNRRSSPPFFLPIPSHPIPSPPFPSPCLACPITHAHARTHTHLQIYDACKHFDVCVCVCCMKTHTDYCQQASPVESYIRPASLKKKIIKSPPPL